MADTIETMELPTDEVLVTDEMPEESMIIVEEPADEKGFDWDQNKDLKKFLHYLQGRMGNIPQHSGNTTAGCERAIAYLKTLDREISKAITEDLDCNIDDQEIEKLRKDIRKMVKKLQKRHNEINDVYDADDDKFAADNNNQLVKKAGSVSDIISRKLDIIQMFADKMGDVDLGEDAAQVILNGLADITLGLDKLDPKWRDKLENGKITYIDDEESNEVNDKAPSPLYCKPASTCACHIEKKADDNCPTCNIKLWKAAEGLYECIACDKVVEKAIVKEAGTPKVQLTMSPFERAITGIIVNAVVSQGKNAEEVYAELKKQYKFSDRDELSIQQLLLDMGYPTARNFMAAPHKNVEFATNYSA